MLCRFGTFLLSIVGNTFLVPQKCNCKVRQIVFSRFGFGFGPWSLSVALCASHCSCDGQ